VKRISWSKIRAGDVVFFRYRGKKEGAKSRRRTCLVLNEKHMYKRQSDGRRVRLVHALQLSAIPRVPGTRILKEAQIKRVLKKVGKIEIREEGTDKERYAVATRRSKAKTRYGMIREVVTQYGIYRTFSWGRLRTKAVFLNEDFEWPKEFVKDLQKVKPVVDEDELDWIE
jgi:hypothetical protein